MEHQSFARWRLPKELDGVVLLDDFQKTRRFGGQERHFHDELELHFVDRGKGVFLLDRRKLSVRAGTLVWVPPARDHLLLESSGDFRRWMLLCRRRLVRRVLPPEAHRSVMARSAIERAGRLSNAASATLRQAFLDVSAHRSAPLPLFNAAVAFALARAWLCFQSAATTDGEPNALHPAVVLTLDLLRHTADRPSLPELAQRSAITESHLSKLFGAQVGMSITDFRNRIGIERFLEAYGDGSRTTVLDAALDAGFGSYPQFHRIFKKEMGYAPAEHRRRVRSAADATRLVPER